MRRASSLSSSSPSPVMRYCFFRSISRGKRNNSSLIRYVAEKIALLRGETFEQVAAYTYRNACTIYGVHD